MNFSSENYDGTHPAIMKALVDANKGFVPSYGKDKYTEAITKKLKAILKQEDIKLFFCFNGTGANNFALSSIADKYQAIFCSDVSHVYTAESTAPEAFTGCRLYPIQSKDGKIIINDLLSQLSKIDNVHAPSPGALTISQPTEYGTVYSTKELKEIARLCKQHSLILHIDGARIFNALAAMNCSFAQLIKISGADAITIGGTKAGLMFGEALVFLKSQRFKNLHLHHKRSMQLASKNRFIAAQFDALFKNDQWKIIADDTNGLARYFEGGIKKIDPQLITCLVETNVVFLKIKKQLFDKLQSVASFYMWDSEQEVARFVFSFSNTKNEIDLFLKKYSLFSIQQGAPARSF